MSARDLPVYAVVAAPPATSGWFNNLIQPALAAAKADGRPVVFQPTGCWGGWAAGGRDTNPDGRISLSSGARFWTKTQFVYVYMHELAHCLLDEVETGENGKPAPGLHGHDGAFLTLLACFLLRLDAIEYIASESATAWINRLDLYDFQDGPDAIKDAPEHVWRSRVLAWSMQIAHQLAPTDKTAREVAEEICRRYWEWCDQLVDEPARKKNHDAAAAAARARGVLLKKEQADQLALWKSLAALFFIGFGSVVLIAVQR